MKKPTNCLEAAELIQAYRKHHWTSGGTDLQWLDRVNILTGLGAGVPLNPKLDEILGISELWKLMYPAQTSVKKLETFNDLIGAVQEYGMENLHDKPNAFKALNQTSIPSELWSCFPSEFLDWIRTHYSATQLPPTIDNS